MSQSKKGSVIETVVNVGSGYFIALILNLLFLPLFAVQIVNQDFQTAAIIGVVYTVTSMIRSFLFRIMFNKVTGLRKWL